MFLLYSLEKYILTSFFNVWNEGCLVSLWWTPLFLHTQTNMYLNCSTSSFGPTGAKLLSPFCHNCSFHEPLLGKLQFRRSSEKKTYTRITKCFLLFQNGDLFRLVSRDVLQAQQTEGNKDIFICTEYVYLFIIQAIITLLSLNWWYKRSVCTLSKLHLYTNIFTLGDLEHNGTAITVKHSKTLKLLTL